MADPDELRKRVRSLIPGATGAHRGFAEAVEMDVSKLSKSLGGVRRFTAQELVDIAEHSGVTVNWLLNGSDDAVTVTAVPAASAWSASAPDSETQSDTRRKILQTAWRLIATLGYHHVRIADIARACGTSSGTIHYYFTSRDDVLHESLRRNVKLAFDRQVAQLHAIDDARQRLVRLVELQLPTDGLLRDEWSVWLQVWNEVALNPRLRTLYWDSYDRWYRTIAMTIRLGQAQGVFRAQDPDHAAVQLTALIDGLGIRVLTATPGSSVEVMRRHLREFINRAIVKEPA